MLNPVLRSGVFAIAIFLSATLIFLVQPLVGKRILPWFGGAPAVWTVCLAFYQTTLFAGYAYAHALVRFTSARLQVAIHAAVLLVAVATLPILPTSGADPNPLRTPESQILVMLIEHVALPFLALAATGPLVQHWFARQYPGRSPYFLYAISNVGSLLGLLGYSFFLESRLSVSDTGTGWSSAFIACGLLVLLAGWRSASGIEEPSSTLAMPPGAEIERDAGAAQFTVWGLLSGSAVILLTGLTNILTLDVASIPFLWVVMLAAYLASYILAFGSEGAYRRTIFLPLAIILLVVVYALPLLGAVGHSILLLTQALPVQVGLYASLLFCLAMILHGELYRVRPAVTGLTRFYLAVSGGGALGGIFAGIVAPRIFEDFHEVFAGLLIGWLALLWVWYGPAQGPSSRPRSAFSLAAVATASVAIIVPQLHIVAASRDASIRHQERSFFGVLRVVESETPRGQPLRVLRNGTTRHGEQLVDSNRRRQPTSYYGMHTGIGLALAQKSTGPAMRIGIVGLGIGTLATYGRPGDSYRVFEIDPAVTSIARNETYFTYLSDSPAEVDIVSGDGRLSLAAELTRDAPAYDLLVVDAFSSDAVPMHLLTREAFDLYEKRLTPGGLIAVHISNRHFALGPVVARSASESGFSTLVVKNKEMPRFYSEPSRWALLTRDTRDFDELTTYAQRILERRSVPSRAITFERLTKADLADAKLWTDDYSDLLGVLR